MHLSLDQFTFLQSYLVIRYTPKDFFLKLITENIAIHNIDEMVEYKFKFPTSIIAFYISMN